MPTPKEIYNQVKEAEAKIDQAQSDFDVMEKRLGEIEDENPELRGDEIIEFMGFQIPVKDVVYIERLESDLGAELKVDANIFFGGEVIIENGRVSSLALENKNIKSFDYPFPDSLEGLYLSGNPITEIGQEFPAGLRSLDLSLTGIRVIGQPLPKTLSKLELNGSLIESLDEEMPEGINYVGIKNTPLADEGRCRQAFLDIYARIGPRLNFK